MHLFLRAIGFSDCSEEQEKRFIEMAIQSGLKKECLLSYCDAFDRVQLLIPTSESMGICVYGRKAAAGIEPLYYFPLVMGSSISNNDELVIERHADKESFEVVCEDIKAGVTLMFYLQNALDYLNFRASQINAGMRRDIYGFDLNRKNMAEKEAIAGKSVVLTALSVGGMVLLPSYGSRKRELTPREAAREAKYRNLIAAAKNGNQDAIESLTIEDLDTYTSISRRITSEDVLSIVESSFMPCGVECDQYSVIGEILELEIQKNVFTEEKVIMMKLDCNEILLDVAINEADLVGEPVPGRRFKGNIWLMGEVGFDEQS